MSDRAQQRKKREHSKALLVIDLQRDFCTGGALPVPEGEKIIPAINAILTNFEVRIFTQDKHPADHTSFASNHPGKKAFETISLPYGKQMLWPDHCIEGKDGAAFHPDLVVTETDFILYKGTNPKIDSYSAFFENDHTTPPLFPDGKSLTCLLQEYRVKELFICGLAYDFCVGWSALDARREGFQVTLLKNLTASLAIPLPNGSNTALEMEQQIQAAGVNIAL